MKLQYLVWRFVYILLFVFFTIVSMFGIEDELMRELGKQKYSFNMSELEQHYGVGSNLSSSDTRKLYKTILHDYYSVMNGSESTLNISQKAVMCSTIRHHVKRYARSRNVYHKWFVGSIMLQLRDAYVHGLSYLPWSMLLDVKLSWKQRYPSLRHVIITLRETWSCLWPTQTETCPSYTFLRTVKARNDSHIANTCFATNTYYDSYFFPS